MKLLIDTNVILDAMMIREPWAQSAQDIILAIAGENAEGYITASTVTDIYYLLRKHLNDKQQTKQALAGLLAVVNVLDVNGVDCEKALDLTMQDFEDALLACCGKRHKVDYIVTRNLIDFKNSPVQAVAPDEILEYL